MTRAEIIDKVCSHLEGTCHQSLDQVLRDEGIEGGEDSLTTDELRLIDDRIFCCSSCGWWCSADELAEGDECQECVDDRVEQNGDTDEV